MSFLMSPRYELSTPIFNVKEGPLSSVACGNTGLIFVGCGGVLSLIIVLSYNGPSKELTEVGRLTGMNGSILTLSLSQPSESKIAACTSAGRIYIWDISEAGIEKLVQQTALLEAMECYVLPQSLQLRPIVSIHPASSGSYTAVDFIANGNFIIGAGRTPGEPLVIYNTWNGCLIATVSRKLNAPLANSYHKVKVSSISVVDVSCIAANKNFRYNRSNKEPGEWIAYGDYHGNLGIIFISSEEIAKLKQAGGSLDSNENIAPEDRRVPDIAARGAAFAVCNQNIEIKSVCWMSTPPESKMLHLALGCSDGFVRFCKISVTSTQFELKESYIKKFCRGDCAGEVRSLQLAQRLDGGYTLAASCNSVQQLNPYQKRNDGVYDASYNRDGASDCIFEVVCQCTSASLNGANMICLLNHKEPIIGTAVGKEGNFLSVITGDRSVFLFKDHAIA